MESGSGPRILDILRYLLNSKGFSQSSFAPETLTSRSQTGQSAA